MLMFYILFYRHAIFHNKRIKHKPKQIKYTPKDRVAECSTEIIFKLEQPLKTSCPTISLQETETEVRQGKYLTQSDSVDYRA